LALNERQFLMLARDDAGRGSGSTRAPVFKSVMLVDTVGATNLIGGPYEAGSVVGGANASGATLEPDLIPVQIEELVNLLNSAQLAKTGMNLKTAPSDPASLSEKWESMAVAPAMNPDSPDDFFLFIGNDNNFRTARLDAAGLRGVSTALTDATSGTGDVDNLVLVYRVSLPTWETEPPKPPAAAKKPVSKKKGKAAPSRKRRRGRR
jgi:hypothetical protein